MTTPVEPPAAVPAPGQPQRRRGGLIALILGIVAIVAAFIPFLSYIAGFIGIAAIIVGAVALRNALNSRGQAITGLILGILAVILAIVMSIIYSTIFFIAAASQSLSSYSAPAVYVPAETTAPSATTPSDDSSSSSSSGNSSARTVTYTVTGAGTAGNITYLTVNGGESGQEQVSDAKLPWQKVVKIKDDGLFESSLFSLVAQKGSGSGKITCEIEADGKVISKHTSSGQYAVVTCSGQAGQ